MRIQPHVSWLGVLALSGASCTSAPTASPNDVTVVDAPDVAAPDASDAPATDAADVPMDDAPDAPRSDVTDVAEVTDVPDVTVADAPDVAVGDAPVGDAPDVTARDVAGFDIADAPDVTTLDAPVLDAPDVTTLDAPALDAPVLDVARDVPMLDTPDVLDVARDAAPDVVDAGPPSVARLTAALRASGFTVQAGTFSVADLAGCCDPLRSCFGNNPSSPYLLCNLPRAPGQTVANPIENASGVSAAWRLRADEAVVLVGRTPPTAAYFGLTPYVFDRDYGASGRQTVFASLGDTLNHQVLATSGTPDATAGDAFARDTLVVATSDRGVDDRVRAAAESVGYPRGIMNRVVFPTTVGRFGLDAAADSFSVLGRVALFADATAGAAWLAAPTLTALRVTPMTSTAPSPAAPPVERRRGTGVSESSLAAALGRLEAAIVARHRLLTPRAITVNTAEVDPAACLASGTNCNGDNRDTVYPRSEFFVFPENPLAFVMVYGVNHEAAGKATYSNFSVYALRHLLGVTSIQSRQLRGSAEDYLPGDPMASQLYAWRVARRCGSTPHCVEIPSDCPGVPTLGFANVTFRAYLETATHTRPLQSELLTDRVVVMEP